MRKAPMRSGGALGVEAVSRSDRANIGPQVHTMRCTSRPHCDKSNVANRPWFRLNGWDCAGANSLQGTVTSPSSGPQRVHRRIGTEFK
jgi:hypothetical protein